MVVMMHSTLGVELAAGKVGYMHHVVEFSRPFGMSDFFLILGLFLSRVVDRDWQTYLDRKVLHVAYFYGFGRQSNLRLRRRVWPQVLVGREWRYSISSRLLGHSERCGLFICFPFSLS